MTLYGIWNAQPVPSTRPTMNTQAWSLTSQRCAAPGYTNETPLYTVQSPQGVEDDKLGVQAVAKLPNLHTPLFPDV